MLRVDVVLCPHGDESETETLHQVYIWNTGNTDCYGWTEYAVGLAPGEPLTQLKHQRDDGALRLVSRTLTALGTNQLRDWPFTPASGSRSPQASTRKARKAKTPRSTSRRKAARGRPA